MAIFLFIALAVCVAFGGAVRHVDVTHRPALCLMCLIGSGVYLAMAACRVIYADADTRAVAAALLGASLVGTLLLRRRSLPLWPDDEKATDAEVF